ncbi:GNAT family N-acetyltransferase [Sphingobium nicotianae]|uniref:GNAT family N-acetyltransferase n=1 Tax=Sphingobium nicotianae TaxID=2782607 RepID=A0A9X1DEK5_9SPHN|nr:GNAT family N-acetyltransferase [Sphingobium nicotianae]MBT2188770.1 GNAT family N-acetyltransferase [Sphingobium nicotianae]
MAEFALPTERLTLRGWRDADHPALLALCTDAAVMEFLGPPQTAEQVQDAIDRQRGFQAEHGYCFWVVERREDGAFLGFCGLKPGPAGTPLEGRIEIGWRFRADSWGRGYAKEAALASLAWGFANSDAPDIRAMTVLANTRGWGLMERLGMVRQPDLDFDHPAEAPDSPLRRHVTYSIARRP